METQIQTSRLMLIALSREAIRLCRDAPNDLKTAIGTSLETGVITADVERALGMKWERMGDVSEADHPWYTYWLIVLREANMGIGLAGFKGTADDAGEVEIGYGIAPEYHNKGYMSEAAQALIDWAFESPQVKAVVTRRTLKTNLASLRVQQKLGFTVYDETDAYLFLRLPRG
jgi:ribosomal-protein-alanine N-acetyltransferase